MGNETIESFLWYFISHQMSFRVKLSLFNLILIHSKTRKSHKNTVKMSSFQKIHIKIFIIYSKQSLNIKPLLQNWFMLH